MNDRSQSDVLVIGGGVIGLACAHYLCQAGRSVRIIDQGKIGSGASSGNCGLVFVSDLVPLCVPGAVRRELFTMLRRSSPLYIKPSFDLGRLLWLLRFSLKCRADHVRHAVQARESLLTSSNLLFTELVGAGSIEAEVEQRGVLLVYRSEAAMQGYEEVNAQLKPYHLAAEAMVGKALLDFEPALREDVFGAWYHRADSHLRPDRLLESWSQALRRAGVAIEEDCGLKRFRSAGNRIQAAVTRRGEFSAATYVLAAGAWSTPVAGQLGLKLPIQPGKGYSITMGRPAVCPAVPCYLYERRVVATPWPSGYRLGGTMEFCGFDLDLNAERLNALKTAAGEYLKDPVGTPMIEEWTGLRPMTCDELPVIGRAPRFRDLILATGHGMLGVTTAPATGKLVAEIACGVPPHIDPRPFAPQRFQSEGVEVLE
jgi:D-amino-acid dehydrogenase